MRGINVDINRLNDVGIDRIILNNFEIKNLDQLNKKTLNTDLEKAELIEVKESLFTLSYSVHTKSDKKSYVIANLEFNPNTILDGHNLYNVKGKGLKHAVIIVENSLKKLGIEIDLREAKIKTLEINKTINYLFRMLEEVLLVIGRTNFRRSIGMYSFQAKNIPNEIREERSLYINPTSKTSQKTVKGKIIKFYDKTFEFFRMKNIKLDMDLTRIEVTAGRDYYREIIEKIRVNNGLENLSNSLEDLQNNDWILEEIFISSLRTEIEFKPKKYIENIIKKNLHKEFINFRRTEKTKREIRKKYIENGKEVPQNYKEERGVFEYLKKNSWIFDYSFLLEIVLEEIDSKSRNKYLRQVTNKYKDVNHLERFRDLLKILNLE